MIGYSPKFPLRFDNEVGAYSLTTTLKEVARQNFKNLLLTAPGERIMDANFGVGLRHYLFEQKTNSLTTTIARKINEQVATYLSYIVLESIEFNEDTIDQDTENILNVAVYFSVPAMGIQERLLIGEDQLNL
jgi:phage baseplate assembly protein W